MKKTLTVLFITALVLLCLSTGAFNPQTGATGLAAPQPRLLHVYAIDVGQGDGLLIVSPTGKTVLVDAGPRSAGDAVVAALRNHRVSSLDLIVASHPHEDHIGGMVEVLDNFPVRRFLDSGRAHPTQTYENLLAKLIEKRVRAVRAVQGQNIDLGGGAMLEVLKPGRRYITRVRPGGSLENANSVVLRLTYGTFAMIFTGDAEMDTEHLLVNVDDPRKLRAQVLKIGHHGSRHATGPDFINAVRPTAAIISASTDNTFGHPTQATLDRLRASRVSIFRTDLQGELHITATGRGRTPFTITTERPATQAALARGRG